MLSSLAIGNYVEMKWGLGPSGDFGCGILEDTNLRTSLPW